MPDLDWRDQAKPSGEVPFKLRLDREGGSRGGRGKGSTFYTEGESLCETLRPEEFAEMKEFKESRNGFTLGLIFGGKQMLPEKGHCIYHSQTSDDF